MGAIGGCWLVPVTPHARAFQPGIWPHLGAEFAAHLPLATETLLGRAGVSGFTPQGALRYGLPSPKGEAPSGPTPDCAYKQVSSSHARIVCTRSAAGDEVRGRRVHASQPPAPRLTSTRRSSRWRTLAATARRWAKSS